MGKRMISTELVEEDVKIENNLRPLSLEDYIGQEKVKRNLKVYIEAAKERWRFVRPCAVLRPAGDWGRQRLPVSLQMKWEPI